MSKKIYRFEDIVGQAVNKAIITNLIQNNRLPQFIFLYGDSGSGKSTMAELIAMSETCTESSLNPCLVCPRCQDNLEALQTTGTSRNIRKINIGTLINKDDVRQMLKEIFSLQAIPGEKTFYILEEVHLLGRNQDMLLEELERIPENTHVIMCTTNYRDILDTLKTRAQLKLHFKRLTPSECRVLIDRLTGKYHITSMTASDKTFLANVANCNAREITNFIETFQYEDDLGNLMRNYFSKVPVKTYINLVDALFKDFPNFIVFLDDLESTINLVDLWAGFNEFVRDATFFMFGSGVTLFTTNEKHSIIQLFSKMSSEQLSKLYRLSHKSANNQNEAEYNLITIREVLNQNEGTAKEMKKETVVENTLALHNSNKSSNIKPKVEVKQLNTSELNNLATNNFVYEINNT